MTTAAATALVLVTLWLLGRLGVVQLAGDVLAQVRRATGDMRNPDLGDAEKERAVRAHSLRLFGLFLRTTLWAAIALALPVGCLALLAAPGWLDFGAVLDAALSWQVIAIATAAGLVLLWTARGRR